MAAFKFRLEIDQGTTFRRRFVWKTGNPPLPVDLTGSTARMQIRPELSSDEVLAELTTENGGITLGGVEGTIDLYLSAEETAEIRVPSGVYDLELVNADGDVDRVLSGGVAISFEVTR